MRTQTGRTSHPPPSNRMMQGEHCPHHGKCRRRSTRQRPRRQNHQKNMDVPPAQSREKMPGVHERFTVIPYGAYETIQINKPNSDMLLIPVRDAAQATGLKLGVPKIGPGIPCSRSADRVSSPKWLNRVREMFYTFFPAARAEADERKGGSVG